MYSFDCIYQRYKILILKLFGSGFMLALMNLFVWFSWETTPLYIMFGDINRVPLPEEVSFIAERTDFFCIEKSQGLRTLGEAGLTIDPKQQILTSKSVIRAMAPAIV